MSKYKVLAWVDKNGIGWRTTHTHLLEDDRIRDIWVRAPNPATWCVVYNYKNKKTYAVRLDEVPNIDDDAFIKAYAVEVSNDLDAAIMAACILATGSEPKYSEDQEWLSLSDYPKYGKE